MVLVLSAILYYLYLLIPLLVLVKGEDFKTSTVKDMILWIWLMIIYNVLHYMCINVLKGNPQFRN